MTQEPYARLHELLEHGQSYWLDNLSRAMIRGGDLQRRVKDEGLRGVTSNPAIFHKAISGGQGYDQQIEELVRRGLPLGEIYEEIACSDLQDACDLLRPVYDASDGGDGYVSLEVSPHLIHDTEGSVEEARRLWKRVARPNLYVKIPGTAAGVPAIEQLIYEGININVTLLFSVADYEEVARAYQRGLQRRNEEGQEVARVTSVASFFLSRIDVLVDELLSHRVGRSVDSRGPRAESLFGKAAVANAKLAYASFERLFSGPEWDRLAAAGASVQRVLWASTSTKNPLYDDVMYVEPLIGPDTVNTMPEVTIEAFANHGRVVPNSVRDGVDDAARVLSDLAELGIDLGAVTHRLIDEGAKKFLTPFDALLDGLAEKREEILGDGVARQSMELGNQTASVQSRLRSLSESQFVRRLYAGDPSLWTDSEATAASIQTRLGWLDLSRLDAEAHAARTFASSLESEGIDSVVVLGMGGSSLTAAVASQTFQPGSGSPDLLVLDDTSPVAVRDLEARINMNRTIFLVASKSGTTLETLSLYRYFYGRVTSTGVASPGGRFVALTDPGSPLEGEAQRMGFRRTFETPTNVGGRFSALTSFGLVPMALLGVDVDAVVDHARSMLISCGPSVGADRSPGVRLGTALADLAAAGHRHVSLAASRELNALPNWIEQILAESTGKDGRGLVPVVSDPAFDSKKPSAGRVFVSTEIAGDRSLHTRLAALAASGHPVIRIVVPTREAIGGEFVRWEIATATAGSLLGINPFDEPDVDASKRNTARLLDDLTRDGAFPEDPVSAQGDGLAAYFKGDASWSSSLANGTLEALVADFVRLAKPENYLGILAYFPETPARQTALDRLRRAIARLGPVTTVAQGPRYLHSTGQLHKGGPATGVFLMLTADAPARVAVPEAEYGFGDLHRAQALGDYEALLEAGRPVLRVNLGWYVEEALGRLAEALD